MRETTVADGTAQFAPVIPLDAARSRRRPAVRASHIPAEHGAGVVVLNDDELDDELAAAQQDADADLVHLLTCPIPRDEDRRDELVGRLAARLAMTAIERRETDHDQVDARESFAADIDALLARLCAVRGAR